MKRLVTTLIFSLLLVSLASCAKKEEVGHVQVSTEACTEHPTETESIKEEEMSYQQISQDEAYEVMNSNSDAIVVDVREQDEYDEGHIPNSILMPYESTNELAPTLLPNKDQTILVYCRSGRRSKIASQELADMGYTDVREFGGIIEWEYETVKE